MFGLPMLAPSSYDAFEKILAQLYTEKKTVTTKKKGRGRPKGSKNKSKK